MNKQLLIIIFCIFLIIHIYNYLSLDMEDMNNFRILHKDIENIDGSKLDRESYPLIMTYIENDTLEYNISRYGVYSPLSIIKKYEKRNSNEFLEYNTHCYSLFYVKSEKDLNITITDKDISGNPSITIKIHPHDIIYIPRFCKWKMNDNINIDIFYAHTPISWLISKFCKCTYKELK